MAYGATALPVKFQSRNDKIVGAAALAKMSLPQRGWYFQKLPGGDDLLAKSVTQYLLLLPGKSPGQGIYDGSLLLGNPDLIVEQRFPVAKTVIVELAPLQLPTALKNIRRHVVPPLLSFLLPTSQRQE